MQFEAMAFIFFTLFSIFIPASFLFSSRMLRKRYAGNPVKNSPYESGEETIGKSRDIDAEYFPYFIIFLPFELIAVFAILWSAYSSYAGKLSGLYVIALIALATCFAIFGYKLINDNHAGK
jgi:NADH:ubiquinone oxidoreductase subunit 3 (subunit A)